MSLKMRMEVDATDPGSNPVAVLDVGDLEVSISATTALVIET